MPHIPPSNWLSRNEYSINGQVPDEFVPPPVASNSFEDAEHQEQDRCITPTEYSRVAFVCPQDILLGRGAPIMSHPGNQYFRELIRRNQDQYNSCRRAEKYPLVKSILDSIEGQGGRFLKQLASGEWYEVSESVAYEKCCQALRECQKTRNKRKQQQQQQQQQQS